MGEPAANQDKTRPSQLMPTGDNAIKALEGFLLVLGFQADQVNGTFSATDKAAYDQARTQYSFLPELTDSPDANAITTALQSIDRGLQNNVAFQQAYIEGLRAQSNATTLQAALVAGGSWANRHLGDRISNAEPIAIDGNRGTLTNRGVRNAPTLTGVATLQSTLNLLTGSNLTPSGIIDAATLNTMQSYSQAKNIEFTDNTQDNFARIVAYIQANEGAALRTKIAEVLNADTDHSAPDARTLDAQIVMNGLARQAGSDTRTAPDSRQTDRRITDETSHTRTVIAPETGVELTPHAPTVGPAETAVAEVRHQEAGPPFGLNSMYRITRHDVLEDVSSITARQHAGETSPQNILAYSQEARGFVLISKTETEGQSAVYQISDRNVSQIMSGINDGSIAIDTSANKYIAEIVHGNSEDTVAYSAQELRTAFAGNATRFTSNTHERLLTTSATLTNGDSITFGLDDFHDALNRLDSKRDWNDQDDRIAVRDYVSLLRNATEDAREERGAIALPQWQGGALDATNSVEVSIAGQTTRIPSQIWDRMATSLETQRGFSTGRDSSTLERRTASAAGTVADGAGPAEQALTGDFSNAGDAAETADGAIARNVEDIGIAGDSPAERAPEVRQPDTAPAQSA